MTAVCVFVAKVPGRRFALPWAIRSLFQAAEWDSDLNRWGAANFYHCNPTREQKGIYYALDSADDPANPVYTTGPDAKHPAKSGAEQFAEFFAAVETLEEEQQVIDSFMINM